MKCVYKDRIIALAFFQRRHGGKGAGTIRPYAPGRYAECVIEGGNHAQFGSCGTQQGDGAGRISAEERQKHTVEYIMTCCKE